MRDAEEMLRLCTGTVIAKTWHYVQHANLAWEVDEFHGELEGLVVAECELLTERQEVEAPPWVGAEVTHDARYYNANLSRWPFP